MSSFFFWRRERDWSVIVPSLIVLGVLTSVLAAIMIYAGQDRPRTGMPRDEMQARTEVQVRYLADMTRLRDDIERSGDDAAVLIQKAEEAFFAARVPEEYLDPHFKAVIALRNLERSLSTKSRIDVQLALFNIILPLSEPQ